jgi:hypothetical protein
MTTTTDSPAYQFIKHIYKHGQEATGHSWARLNTLLYQAVTLAINVGLRFDRADFGSMFNRMRGNYWFREDHGERWYTAAIEAGNSSAFKAYEVFRHRIPFILQTSERVSSRHRLHVGSKFKWPSGESGSLHLTLTSFTDPSHIVACSYKRLPAPNLCPTSGRIEYTYGPRKIAKCKKITHADIRAYHARLKECAEREAGSADAGGAGNDG